MTTSKATKPIDAPLTKASLKAAKAVLKVVSKFKVGSSKPSTIANLLAKPENVEAVGKTITALLTSFQKGVARAQSNTGKLGVKKVAIVDALSRRIARLEERLKKAVEQKEKADKKRISNKAKEIIRGAKLAAKAEAKLLKAAKKAKSPAKKATKGKKAAQQAGGDFMSRFFGGFDVSSDATQHLDL